MNTEKPQFSFPNAEKIDIVDIDLAELMSKLDTEEARYVFNILKNRSDIAIVGKLYDVNDIQDLLGIDEKTAKEFLDNVDTDTKEIHDDCDNAISALFENFNQRKI
ncbi:hypothetical protein EBU91_02470 [bacterium]|nr:hypothetical protein [bacterium]